MRDMSIPTSIAARHAGPTPGGQTYFPLICSKVSSSSMKKLFHVAFVNANGVAIRIENHRHAANGRLDRFDAELHVLFFQMRDGVVEVLDLERSGATVRTWLKYGRRSDGECIGAEFVFRPLAVLGLIDGRGIQSENALVKRAGARHVRHGVTTKGEFNNFEHKRVRSLSSQAIAGLHFSIPGLR